MAKKQKKKVNPRRIPMPKSAIDKDAILSEAMQDDMYRAWLLVVNALVEQEQIPLAEIPELADTVNQYVSKASFRGKSRDIEMAKAERLMGIPNPYEHLNPDAIKSEVELARFKEKVFKVATHTALCVICLGLEATARFQKEDLRRLFFHVDLTLAEIDGGHNSYQEIEEYLSARMVTIEIEDGEYSTVNIEV